MLSPKGVLVQLFCTVEVTSRKCIKGPEGAPRKRPRSPSPLPGARKRKRCVYTVLSVVNMALYQIIRNTVRRKIKDDDADFE